MLTNRKQIADAILEIDLRGVDDQAIEISHEFRTHNHKGTVALRLESGQNGKTIIYSKHPIHIELIHKHFGSLDSNHQLITSWCNWKDIVLDVLLKEGATTEDARLIPYFQCIQFITGDSQSMSQSIVYFDMNSQGVMALEDVVSDVKTLTLVFKAVFIRIKCYFPDSSSDQTFILIYYGTTDIDIGCFIAKEYTANKLHTGMLSVPDYVVRVLPYLRR